MTVGTLAFKAIGTATILLAASGYAAADSYVFLGNGVCRAVGDARGPVFSSRDVTWKECREMCSGSSACRGIEFNVHPDRTGCENHHYEVRVVQRPEVKDRLLSCWVRQ